jgi:type IV secretion system protein VirB1
MILAFNPMSCPNLAVPAEVMQHVVKVESGFNPFAIGVVGGRLERQPHSFDEAVATARMLETKGYDYSLGIAQINRSNLAAYGLDTYKKAFDGCINLAAGARILAECRGRSAGDWGKALSCYYSGNFDTGFREGYVQRIYSSISASFPEAYRPITVYPETRERPVWAPSHAARSSAPGSQLYRVALRSIATDVTPIAQVFGDAQSGRQPTKLKRSAPEARHVPEPALSESEPQHSAAFVPRIRSSDDSFNITVAPAAVPSDSSLSLQDAAALSRARQESADAAFVF